jgi:uncharacterized protein YjiS (DUF1127 family)
MTLIAIITTVASVIRKWRRNHHDRRVLASLPAHDRYELSLLGDVATEIAKPFWRD